MSFLALIKKILFSPLGLIYGVITSIRNLLYNYNVLKSTSFTIPTICVGNLAVGGTGKTPHIEYLIQLLQNNYKIATLSRGYKRKTKGFILANNNSTVFDIGDEPLQLKYKFQNIIVSVNANRVNGVKALMELPQAPQLILLDDAFQHRAITCKLNILISDYKHIYTSDLPMPAGQLREFAFGANRANIIIISKTPENTTKEKKEKIKKQLNLKPHQYLFFSYINYLALQSFSNPQNILSILNLYQYHVLLITGIGNANGIYTYLKEYADNVKQINYIDHHSFTIQNLNYIKQTFDNLPNHKKIIVTTEKDSMRLKSKEFENIINSWPLYVLPITIDFKEQKEDFETLVKHKVYPHL